jgi:hypothetical protein
MAKVFMIWVKPGERKLLSGETYDEAVIREAGYEPTDLIGRGEAVWASPASPEKPEKRKK